jgi:hypothetical protein
LGKLILLLILAFGVSLYLPQTRPMVLDTLAPVLNPVLEWQTTGELNRISRDLAGMNRRGEKLPAPGEQFLNWMERNYQEGGRTDSWDNPYTLRIWADSLGVLSRGPDLELGTADDLLVTQSIEGGRGRSRRRR